jgi:hypothetical protein
MSYLTSEDEQNFGREIIDLIQRGSRQAMAPILDRLQQEDAELREGLQRATKTAIDRALDTAVPNWREVNQDPRWFQWLNSPEPYSGYRRQDLLNDATAKGDAGRVIVIFKGFIAAAGGQPAQPGQPGQSGQPASVLPSRYPARATGRIYSRDQILQMSARKRRGEFTDQQWLEWERELIAAGREGRIANGLNPQTGCQY